MKWWALAGLVACGVVVWLAKDPRSSRAPRAAPPVAATPEPKPPPQPEPAPRRERTAHEAALLGRVVDAAGRPIAGAVVRYNDMDATREWKKAPHVTTDVEGRFRARAWATLHELMVAAEGYGEEYARTYPDDPGLRIALQKACTLAGRVLTPDGRPAARAELSVWDSTLFASTDEAGRFELKGLRPGEVTVHGYWAGPISLPGAPDAWCRWDWHFELAPGEARRGVELQLAGYRYSWLPLRLVDGRGRPIAGAKITDTGTLDVLDEPGAPTILDEDGDERRVTDSDGFVLLRCRDQPGYDTTIEFSKGDWEWQRFVSTLPPGTERVVTLTLAAPTHVTFILLDERGNPIPAAAEPFLDVDHAHTARVREVGRDGHRFELLVDVADDGYMGYVVEARGYADFEVPRWRPQPQVVVRLKREARVRGRVLGLPAVPDETLRVHCGEFGARPGADGRFELDTLPAGPTTLRVSTRASWPILRRPVTLQEGDNDLGDFRLPPARVYHGRVVDGAGRGVGGARVQVLEPGRTTGLEAVSRPDGTFQLELFGLDDLLLVARKPGLTSAPAPPGRDLVVRPSPTIRLWPGDTIWRWAQLTTAQGHVLRLDRMSFQWAFRGDGLRLVHLPQGRWTLELVGHFEVVTKAVPVALEPGRTVRVDLR